MTLVSSADIACIHCPMRDDCESYIFFTTLIGDLMSQVQDLRMELEATTK